MRKRPPSLVDILALPLVVGGSRAPRRGPRPPRLPAHADLQPFPRSRARLGSGRVRHSCRGVRGALDRDAGRRAALRLVLPRAESDRQRAVLPRQQRQPHHQRGHHPAPAQRRPERPLLRLPRLRQEHRHAVVAGVLDDGVTAARFHDSIRPKISPRSSTASPSAAPSRRRSSAAIPSTG